MKVFRKRIIVIFLLLSGLAVSVSAAPRDAGKADSGAVQKLQMMVKSLTSERDAAKAEASKVLAEVEQLKKENKEHMAAIKSTEAAKQQVDSELTAQKTSTTEVQSRLEQTNTRLLEVIEKYKVLNQSKNELTNELAVLNNKHQTTEQKLTTCEERNVKLYESGKELLERYQTKGTLTSVLQDEPLLQFNSVEMETIKQDYEDKLRSGVYKP
ncbi:hypothetical protein [Methylomonas sp. AM2-LC]|uniref:hypothetical protein n=1 Tax=Methylomonas sp. AM2-LC TaxID=3153301 RepID=UPI003262D68B